MTTTTTACDACSRPAAVTLRKPITVPGYATPITHACCVHAAGQRAHRKCTCRHGGQVVFSSNV